MTHSSSPLGFFFFTNLIQSLNSKQSSSTNFRFLHILINSIQVLYLTVCQQIFNDQLYRKKKVPSYNFCQFWWYKYYHYGRFQVLSWLHSKKNWEAMCMLTNLYMSNLVHNKWPQRYKTLLFSQLNCNNLGGIKVFCNSQIVHLLKCLGCVIEEKSISPCLYKPKLTTC